VTDVVLSVQDLTVRYKAGKTPLTAVSHMSFDIRRGEILGIAGESGSGKSTAAQAIARIGSAATLVEGHVFLNGTDLLSTSAKTLRELRWSKFSLVTQSVMGALNPLTTIGTQFFDAFLAHQKADRIYMMHRTQELLQLVGLSPDVINAYPHQLSGGMRQRVGIALAMMFNPDLIIMDEPTTALDVVVERDLLMQIKTLQAQFGFAILFITHDLSLLFRLANRIAIMYAGELVEEGPVEHYRTKSIHPYTIGLVHSFPSITGGKTRQRGISGSPPTLGHLPKGCHFHPRCPLAIDQCREEAPAWVTISLDPPVGVKCLRWEENL